MLRLASGIGTDHAEHTDSVEELHLQSNPKKPRRRTARMPNQLVGALVEGGMGKTGL